MERKFPAKVRMRSKNQITVPSGVARTLQVREGDELEFAVNDRGEMVVREAFVPDLETGRFRPSLRVRSLQGHSGIYEMTWAPDGRATWEYGQEQFPGKTHVIWRRVGARAVFDPGPP